MPGRGRLGVPWVSADRQYGRLAKSLDDAIGFGLTTVVEPQNSLDDLALFARARAEGRLRSRIVAALFHPRGTTDADLDDFAEAARRHHDDRLRVGPLKLFSRDILRVGPEDIPGTVAEAVIVGGEVVRQGRAGPEWNTHPRRGRLYACGRSSAHALHQEGQAVIAGSSSGSRSVCRS
ncbi:hypothetical protein [Streptomyces sp. NPDC058989]|uniref:hypothetical protein n=1 Tax=Streptomyces sp. NPDC058989 TaxID=3346686 RepID=UPI00367C8158